MYCRDHRTPVQLYFMCHRRLAAMRARLGRHGAELLPEVDTALVRALMDIGYSPSSRGLEALEPWPRKSSGLRNLSGAWYAFRGRGDLSRLSCGTQAAKCSASQKTQRLDAPCGVRRSPCAQTT
jgi:hypothetical protein